MVTDGTTELDAILEKALSRHYYRAGLLEIMQGEHDRVTRYNKNNPPGAGDCPLVPMFGYLLDRFDEAWAKLHPTEEAPDSLVDRLKESPGTLALMSMLTPETTVGQFKGALMRIATDLTRN